MPSASHPSGLATAMRLQPPADAAVGYEDAYVALPECFITVKEIVANRKFEDEVRGLNRILFLFHLNGQRTVDITDVGTLRLNGPSFYVQYLPRGTTKMNTWTAGDHETVVAISFDADRTPKLVQDVLGSRSVQSALNPVAEHEPILLKCPLSLEMEQAARNMLLPNVHASLLPHFILTKASELLCLGLDSILFTLSSELPKEDKLHSKIRHAGQVLEQEFQSPPSVAELSKIVNLPADVLAREFWKIYGVSVTEFLTHQRMKMAQHALVTTDLPLKRISYDVGYQHTSNFCTAFKRHFGRTPTEVRRAVERDTHVVTSGDRQGLPLAGCGGRMWLPGPTARGQ